MRVMCLCLSLTLAVPLAAADKAPARKREPKVTSAPRIKNVRPVSNAKTAEEIAERETGGIAVSSHRIPLNGATGGWEVEIHMPKAEKGFRCVVDNDTHAVHSKTMISNPTKPGRRH